ncbi:hypothetical protein [Streptomyces sp. ISID311]|uniref:hypothetical protein n=2 Tax=Streptomyces TaxID=1883 RepID=UPI0011BD4323|nr:hypothetical protein [Streptomyces sp. ISID311]TXC96732.1 hypothetical protein FS847_16405 [Streptomyces sp. ISID311]
MSNSTPALRGACGRRRTRCATLLAAATLVAAPLMGTASPATAEETQKPQMDPHQYEKIEDVQAAMQKWAPLADAETVMGYPQVEDQVTTLADVEKTGYKANDAIEDAKAEAKKYADNEKNREPLRESAKHLVDGWPDAGPQQANDIRDNSKATGLEGGQSAQAYCNMVNKDPDSKFIGQTAPCVFVGKIAKATEDKDKWPVFSSGPSAAGVTEFSRKVATTVAQEKSVTEGFEAGGKITPKVGDGKSEVAGEVSFSYNHSSTYTTKVQGTTEDLFTVKELPKGSNVSLEARGNGAYYTGYIVLRENGQGGQRLVAIPARAYVQTPGSGQPVTWLCRANTP